MELATGILRFLFEHILAIEGGTWGGRVNLVVFCMILVFMFVAPVFRIFAQFLTAAIAKRWGLDPGKYLPTPRSLAADVFLLIAVFVISLFSVWITGL